MNAPVLDTLRTAQTLKTAGFPPEQAEATARVLGDALADVATKADLDDAVASVKSELNTEIARVDAKLDAMDEKFETKLDAMDQKFEARFDAMDQKFEAKFDAMDQKSEAKFDGVQAQFNGVQAQFDGVQRQLDGVQRQLDGLQNQLVSLADSFKLHIRVTYGLLGIILALLLARLVAPYISWSDPAAVTPTEAPEATAGEHAGEAQAAAEPPTNT